MSSFIAARVSNKRVWAPGLVTLQVDQAISFKPGQFVNLALEVAGQRVRRSYSLASAPLEPMEFYVTDVEGGALSPSLCALQVGDHLEVDSKPLGFLTLDHVPRGQDLWLMATGTGLGPFISLLRAGEVFSLFERVLVVHGVRESSQLGYREELQALTRLRGEAFHYLPIQSRGSDPSVALSGRIPALITDGTLERAAGLSFAAERSQVLLCGNPNMIRDCMQALEPRGLKKHRARAPGHVSSENYW